MNAEMNALIDQAKREKKFLFSAYQQLWFAPDELREAQANGRFQWGAVNWAVCDPYKHLADLEREATHAQRAVEAFKTKVEKTR